MRWSWCGKCSHSAGVLQVGSVLQQPRQVGWCLHLLPLKAGFARFTERPGGVVQVSQHLRAVEVEQYLELRRFQAGPVGSLVKKPLASGPGL
jgi:hypothetical protein